MRPYYLVIVLLVFFNAIEARSQDTQQDLKKAFEKFESDEQLKHAISSISVIDARTGEVVFARNENIGLAPASTQKMITSATAFEVLGKTFQFKTQVGYTGKMEGNSIRGNLFVIGSGDPTFGSWRWETTRTENILQAMTDAFRRLKIKSISGGFDFVTNHFETKAIADGWIWQDIGNYYGAGATALNWRENQFDLFLRSGERKGDTVQIVGTEPILSANKIFSEVVAAEKGTGDNAYIYLPMNSNTMIVRGTIPVDEKRFRISGTIPDPSQEFYRGLMDSLLRHKIELKFKEQDHIAYTYPGFGGVATATTVYTHSSPMLDSIIYWFNRRSINLYGEALIKTMAFNQKGHGSTDSGVALVKKFWKDKGIAEDELNIYDGSGLSPLNRVTTHAQVQVLFYARKQDWFPVYYLSIPEYNGMKLKSGTISDVKGFCGYHTSRAGKEYIVSFLVNNYSGRASSLVNKMYKVLDCLK